MAQEHEEDQQAQSQEQPQARNEEQPQATLEHTPHSTNELGHRGALGGNGFELTLEVGNPQARTPHDAAANADPARFAGAEARLDPGKSPRLAAGARWRDGGPAPEGPSAPRA